MKEVKKTCECAKPSEIIAGFLKNHPPFNFVHISFHSKSEYDGQPFGNIYMSETGGKRYGMRMVNINRFEEGLPELLESLYKEAIARDEESEEGDEDGDGKDTKES